MWVTTPTGSGCPGPRPAPRDAARRAPDTSRSTPGAPAAARAAPPRAAAGAPGGIRSRSDRTTWARSSSSRAGRSVVGPRDLPAGRRRPRVGGRRVRLGRRKPEPVAWRGLGDQPLGGLRCRSSALLEPTQRVVCGAGRAALRGRGRIGGRAAAPWPGRRALRGRAALWPRSWASRLRSRSIERHLQRSVLERRAGRMQGGERRREHDRPSLPVDADDQLEPDLLQRDVALARERQRQAQARLLVAARPAPA